jgi:hypothetical protein
MDPLMANIPGPVRPPAIKALIENTKKADALRNKALFNDRGKNTFSDRVHIVTNF